MGLLRTITELTASFRAADVLVLCYHQVRDREVFAAQMAALADHGYPVVSIQEFTAWLTGQRVVMAPSVLLTFDGCYSDQLEHAVPVLNSLKFPATFFPASAGLTCELPDVAAHWRNRLLGLAKAGTPLVATRIPIRSSRGSPRLTFDKRYWARRWRLKMRWANG